MLKHQYINLYMVISSHCVGIISAYLKLMSVTVAGGPDIHSTCVHAYSDALGLTWPLLHSHCDAQLFLISG